MGKTRKIPLGRSGKHAIVDDCYCDLARANGAWRLTGRTGDRVQNRKGELLHRLIAKAAYGEIDRVSVRDGNWT